MAARLHQDLGEGMTRTLGRKLASSCTTAGRVPDLTTHILVENRIADFFAHGQLPVEWTAEGEHYPGNTATLQQLGYFYVTFFVVG